MNAIIFDTETNGKAKNFKALMADVDNWPRITQLAWQKVNLETGEVIHEKQHLIYPDGWTIPSVEEGLANGLSQEEAEKEAKFFIDNNMSTQRCMDEGEPIHKVLQMLIEDMNDSLYLVAHNINFDVNVVGAEMIRLDMSADRRLKRICTMESSTNFCRLPGKFRGKFKWPSLQELHRILFNEDFDGAHDAMADVTACSKSLIELINRKVIVLR